MRPAEDVEGADFRACIEGDEQRFRPGGEGRRGAEFTAPQTPLLAGEIVS